MNNRIDSKFSELRGRKKKAFIAFITAGDPNLKVTEELVLSFEKAGVDIMELGVPFSDPLADGPVIQEASARAIKAVGANGRSPILEKIFHTVRRIRQKSQIPIALMTYYNPVFHYGEDRFVVKAKQSGVDGLIVPDLPPEEAGSLIRAAKRNHLSLVFFLSPTTTKKRMQGIVKAATGFIYYVSVTGVTGERGTLPTSLSTNVRMAKRFTKTPVCVGFGVSTAAQVRSLSRIADGVIVGSAIIKHIEKNTGKKDLVKNVTRFVRKLSRDL